VATAFAVRWWNELEFSDPNYWRFLFAPWRVGFFIAAFVGINVIAPYSGDATWDYVDASFMAILAYTTAPACVAILYQCIRTERSLRLVPIAVAIWLFSASWSYDIYLYFRDGVYPYTWSANLFASSFLYLSAGLFWTLDWQPERGTYWAFADETGWPAEPAEGATLKMLRVVWIFVIPVGLFFLMFLVPEIESAAHWLMDLVTP
jgi:hypothetical protein